MAEQLIRGIRVEGLFGLYDYTLPTGGGNFSDAAILYGDNGLGKSTILRVVFHLLSSAANGGHRNALLKIPFAKVEVDLASGTTLKAVRNVNAEIQCLTLTVELKSKILAEWQFDRSKATAILENASGGVDIDALDDSIEGYALKRTSNGKFVLVPQEKKRSSHPRGEKAYLDELRRHVPAVYLLSADRRLDSDSVADPSDEVELRRLMRFGEPKKVNDLVVRSREIALSQALSAAARWISRKAVLGANQGSTNVHGVYVNVLRHLVGSNSRNTGATTDLVDVGALAGKLASIESRSVEYAKYEFTPALSTSDLKRALNASAKNKRELAAGLLKPYVESLEGRLEALEAIYLLVDRFVSTVNGFLTDKTLAFKLSSGFQIRNRLGESLEPGQLSSGEQQLLLLFSYVLTSHDNSSIFIIDEPEISLNIKWQRRLIKSLLDITSGAKIQFIFASHSIELISQHRDKVVVLGGTDAQR